MQRRRVQISVVWPHQRVSFGIDLHTIEKPKIPQRPEHLTRKNRAKVDHLLRAIVKPNAERVIGYDLEVRYSVNRVSHLSGCIGSGPSPSCNRSQLAASSPCRNLAQSATRRLSRNGRVPAISLTGTTKRSYIVLPS